MRRVEAKRDATNQAASATPRENEGLRRAYLQDSPRRSRHFGVAVLSDFILNCHDRDPTVLPQAEKYRQRFPTG
ncbi:hypothetical protein LIER_18506 [Lithospermum erythrorhizon]|uniref:Uncharacterized protein n=1 Tax=Lithospermum erythrorhizon TaxID=34254 RepID=A0AAV3QEE3_LITER